MPKWTHIDKSGKVRMVDVSSKRVTRRSAAASALVKMNPRTLREVLKGKAPKGDVLAVSRLAGISAAKRTSELIPLAHPIPITNVEVTFDDSDAISGALRIVVRVSSVSRTGVEMEAMTAAAVAALALYDMCKSADRSIEVSSIRLERKEGGRSGLWLRKS